MIIVIVVVTTVLLLVVVVVGLVAMVAVVCRRRSKEHVYENDDTNRGVSLQMTDNSFKSTTYHDYEPMSLDVDPTHFHRQPHPLHTPYTNTTPALSNTDNGDHISMQDCPAYQPIEDTPTLGEYTYI